MTEDEAKTKRCCGGRDCGSPGPDGATMCIGSACMAWNWTRWLIPGGRALGGGKVEASESSWALDGAAPVQGRCGLVNS